MGSVTSWVQRLVSANQRMLLMGFLSSSLVLACAPEKSAEERRREQEQRELQRLGSAEGSFLGQVQLPNGGGVPFALDIAVAKNADAKTGNNKPELTAKARLGLFEGTELIASAVSFDSGAHALTVVFDGGAPPAGAAGLRAAVAAPSPGGKSLELRAVVTPNGLTSATLVGSGGTTYALSAERATQSAIAALAEQSFEFAIDTKLDEGESTPVLLTLKRVNGSIAAPESSDLPTMPKLEGSLRFPGASIVAHRATAVEYDALADTLQLVFNGGNESAGGLRLSFNKLSQRAPLADIAQAFTSDPLLSGKMSLNGANIAALSTSSLKLKDLDGKSLPPPSYVGTMRAADGGVTFDAIGHLTYLGNEITGDDSTGLSQMPNLRLKVMLCLNGNSWGEKEFDLKAWDYLRSTGTFPEQNSAAPYLFRAHVSDTWNKLSGRFITPEEQSSDSSAGTQLQLSAVESNASSCADLYERSRSIRHRLRERDNQPPAQDESYLTYEGYMTRGSGGTVPIGITIFPKRNPGGGSDAPSLQVTARIGFFGGATIASEPAVFNWGNGRLSASFTRPSGAPLEFRTTLKLDALDDASLIGPNLGLHNIRVAHGAPALAGTDPETTMNVAMASTDAQSSVRSVLTLRTRQESVAAPATIDLPNLPSIEASLRIDGLGKTPQVSRRVVYDVLRGTIDVYFSESSILEFTDVFLNAAPSGSAQPYVSFTELDGVLSIGGHPIGTAKSALAAGAERWSIMDLPPKFFIGRYQGGGSALQSKVYATLEDGHSSGTNTAEWPFTTFPNMKLKLVMCILGQQMEKSLAAVDYLGSRVVFRSAGQRDDIDLVFSNAWATVQGQILDADGGSSSAGNSTITLHALPNATSVDCQTAQPSP